MKHPPWMPEMPSDLLQTVAQELPSLVEESLRLNGLSRSRWFQATEGKVYLRVNRRALEEGARELSPVLELASIELHPSHRGKGIFKEVLAHLEQQAVALGRGVFVENTLEDILEGALGRYGYHRRQHVEPPCFWKGHDELAVAHRPRSCPRP